jgi:hypothetical protein
MYVPQHYVMHIQREPVQVFSHFKRRASFVSAGKKHKNHIVMEICRYAKLRASIILLKKQAIYRLKNGQRAKNPLDPALGMPGPGEVKRFPVSPGNAVRYRADPVAPNSG